MRSHGGPRDQILSRLRQPVAGRALPGRQHRKLGQGETARLHRRDRGVLGQAGDPELHADAEGRRPRDLGRHRITPGVDRLQARHELQGRYPGVRRLVPGLQGEVGEPTTTPDRDHGRRHGITPVAGVAVDVPEAVPGPDRVPDHAPGHRPARRPIN